MDLLQQTVLIWDFTHHGEGQGEVGLSIDTEVILVVPVEPDAVGHPRLCRPPPQHTKHLLADKHKRNPLFLGICRGSR